MARKRRTYSAEFRAEAVRLVLESGLKHVRVARDLGIPESSVSRWVRQARIDAGQGQAGELTTDERAELVRLRRENRILQQEREILKNPLPSSRRRCRDPVSVHLPGEGFSFRDPSV